jgi:hypothetical protein
MCVLSSTLFSGQTQGQKPLPRPTMDWTGSVSFNDIITVDLPQQGNIFALVSRKALEKLTGTKILTLSAVPREQEG